MKIDLHIEIVSSELSALSSLSERSRQAVYDVLIKHYTKVSISLVSNLADLEALVAKQPDLVFLGIKYIPLDPTDVRGPLRLWLADYLNEHGIASTGSGSTAHQLDLNKSFAKQRVLSAGLATSPYFVVAQNEPLPAFAGLTFPLFVKPTDRGGGMGVDSTSVVRNAEDLQSKVQSLANDLQADALVERYLSGREFSVAVLKNELLDDFLVMPIELISQPDVNGALMLSSAVKEADVETILSVDDVVLRSRICQLALSVFTALGGRDYGRIDIRLDESGTPNFLEANLIPCVIGGFGSFPKACYLNAGIEYEPMLLQIVQLALNRKPAIKYTSNFAIDGFTVAPALAAGEPV